MEGGSLHTAVLPSIAYPLPNHLPERLILTSPGFAGGSDRLCMTSIVTLSLCLPALAQRKVPALAQRNRGTWTKANATDSL